MRVIKEIPYANFKITIFQWNGKYLIKIESGQLEQTFKMNELDVTSEEDVLRLLDEPFIEEVMNRFHEMSNSLGAAFERHL
ncbi:MAG: hypothetical protein KBF45_04320 [Cyclobacteriaceae bacterium]|jgi:hypothetical protein|nr:hypothetical protein [Cyclobacteriaceae bacterium]